jgi:hypothetical protein
MNENEQTVVDAIMKHCSWSLESLRLEPLETDGEIAEAMVEVMAGSLALDDGAFIAFIAQVLETGASMKAIMAAAERCNWPEPVV